MAGQRSKLVRDRVFFLSGSSHNGRRCWSIARVQTILSPWSGCTVDVASLVCCLILARRGGSTALPVLTVNLRLLLWGGPCRQRPYDSSETLDSEPCLFPLPARFAGSVKSTKSGVDGSLIGLGTKLVTDSLCGSSPRSTGLVGTQWAITVDDCQ